MFIESRTLPVLIFILIVSLVLASCGSRYVPTQETAPSEPTGATVPTVDTSKSITIVIAEDPPSFNPLVADTGFDALVMELVMLGMTDVDPNGNIFPELAAELPTVENGGVIVDEESDSMSVTWKMRDDVQWQDGIAVTANDVLFTWNAISDHTNGSWIPGSDYIESVEKVDDYSFRVNYSSIYPGYLTQFGGR
jgi:peptide/nickel transport system substrate-binding protein